MASKKILRREFLAKRATIPIAERDRISHALIEKFLGDGLQRVCVTSIKCDGMLSGPDIDLYKRLQRDFPQIRFTASGGVSSKEDLLKLNEIDIDSVIVGKAVYENRISLAELAEITSE